MGKLKKFNIDLWDENKTIKENAEMQKMAYSSLPKIIKDNGLKFKKKARIDFKIKGKRVPVDILTEDRYIPKHRETIFVGGHDGYSVTANEGEIL